MSQLNGAVPANILRPPMDSPLWLSISEIKLDPSNIRRQQDYTCFRLQVAKGAY